MTFALELDHITCEFAPNSGDGSTYTAVRDATLQIRAGEFVSVVGPTGCGKSTLLNVAAGLLAPTKGVVRVHGVPLKGLNTRAGYMFQSEALLPWRTALENVLLGLEYKGVPKDQALARAMDWLSKVGLSNFAHSYIHQLSGGMRKRVALAQTMVLNPDIILMDEPFSALDVQTRQLMEDEVLDIWSKEKKAVLFITHDLDEAIALSDRVIVLSAGPATHPMGEFDITLVRPRNVAEIRHDKAYTTLHEQIWDVLRGEVLKGYQQQINSAPALRS